MSKIGVDLGSIYSSLDLKLDKFESSVTNALQGFYKLQTGTEKASSIMDTSVNTAVTNIAKSYDLWEKANEKTGKSIFDNSKKIDSFKSQIKLLDDEIKKSEEIFESIEKQCGKNSEEAEIYKSRVLDMKLAQSQLTAEMKKSESATGTFSGKLELLEKEFDKIDKKYEAFDKVGNSLTNVGSKLTMGVTVPLIGLEVASTKLFGDFEHGTAKISTIADTSKLSIDKISEGVKNLSTTTGVSTNDLNEALYETLSAGVDTSKSVDFLNIAVKAAKGGFTDTATAVDGLTTVLNSYGLTADKANDIANQMLITQNLGKTTFGELASAVGKVTPVSAALGITTNELFSSLASTTSQGLATSESVTALKAAMSNIIKPTKEAGEAAQSLGIDFSVSSLQSKGWIGFLGDLKTGLQKASPEFDKLSVTFGNNAMKMLELEKAGKKTSAEYKNLQKENKNLNKELELLAQAADSPIGAMATMFGSVEGLNSILMLTSEQGIKIYDDSMKQMTENTEALEDAYKKMSNTSTEKFAIQLNKLKIAGIEMGNKLMPLAEKGVKFLGDLAEGFSNLSPTTQEWIVKAGLATAVLGPLTSAIGGTVKGIGGLLSTGNKVGTFFGLFKAAPAVAGSIIEVGTATTVTTGAMATLGTVALPLTLAVAAVGGAIYATHENNEMLSKSCNVASEELSSMERVMAILGGVTLNTKEEMSAMGIKYGEWNKNISPETQTALTDITKKIGTLKLEIANGSGIENFISTADGIQVQQQVSELIEGVKKKIKEKTPEVQTKLKELFNSDGIIDEEEEKTLAAMDNGNKNQLIKLEEHNVKFKELSIKMEKESGDAKIATRKLIDAELDAIGEVGRQATVKNEEEDLASRADFNTRIKGLDVTALSEIMVEKAKMRDENVAKETLNYNTSIEAMRLSLEGKNEVETTYINGSITKLEKQRDDSIQKENEKYAGYLKTAAEGNSQIGTSMDLHNGEMLTKAEKAKREQLLEYGSRMEGLLGITTTGWYNVKNTTDGKMHETFVSVNEKTGMIEKVWDDTTKSIIGKPITAEERINHPKIASAFNIIEGNYDGVKDSILRKPVEINVKKTSNPFGWLTNAYNSTQNWLSEHPLISAVVNGGRFTPLAIPGNATGTDYFKGGLTWIDEEGSELIELPGSGPKLVDLPRGAKIYNNSKSNSMKEQMMGSKSPKATAELFPRKVDFLNLAQTTGSFDLMSDEQKKNLDTIKNKYDKLNSLSDLGSVGLGAKTNNEAEELAKMSLTIAKQVEKLEILKKEYTETKALLGGNSKEVIGLEKNMTSLTVEIENNKKSLEQSQIKNNFKATYDEIELALIKLSGKTGSFSEEMSKQEKVYALNLIKINSMQQEYSELSKVLGESSDEVKQLEKSIISLNIELENSAEKLREDMINNINAFDNKLIEALKNRYDNEEKLQEDSINNELQSLDKWKDESIKIINDVYDAKIKAIEDSSNVEAKALEDEINALDESEKQKDRTETDTKELSKIDNLKDAIGFEHNDFNKAEMQKELNNFIQDREKRLHKESLEDKKEALKKQIDLIKENAKKQKEQLELDKQQKIKNNEELYKNNKDTLNKKIEDIKKFYADKTKSANLQAKAEKLIMDNNQKEIVELLKSYSPQYEEAGKTLGERMADGFKGKMQSAISMIEGIESRINSLRDIDMQNALTSVNYVPSLMENNVGSTTTSSSVVNNKNNIVFNSPKALTPSETQKQTETTLRRLGFAL